MLSKSGVFFIPFKSWNIGKSHKKKRISAMGRMVGFGLIWSEPSYQWRPTRAR